MMDEYEMEIVRNNRMRDIDIAKNNIRRIIEVYISLDDRSRDILKCCAEKVTLKKLGIKYKISANRVMQIESSAISKILRRSGINDDLSDKYRELLTAEENKYKIIADEIEKGREEEIRLKIKYGIPL